MVFKALLDWFIKPLGEGRGGKSKAVGERVGEPRFVPSGSVEATAATILVADFDGSRGHDAAVRVADMIARQQGLEVRRLGKVLKPQGSGSLAQKLLIAADMGRDWLVGENADLMVWGTVEAGGVTLRFLPRVADVDSKPGSFGLGDTLEVPATLGDDFIDVVVATALAAAAPAREGRRTMLVQILTEVCDKANGYVEAPPPDLSPAQFASMLNCLGNAFGMLYRLSRDKSRLARSMKAHQAAIAQCSKDDAPLVWAMCQNHLAASLEAKADADKTTEPLQEAIQAYEAVTDTLGKGTYPHDWAMGQTRLGQLHYKIAMRGGRATGIKQAVAAFELALQVYTREAMPGRWAEVMNQMGVALLAMGEQVTGTVPLEQAVACFRKAIEVRRRDKAPLLWAQTANNLGAAAFGLAKRSGDTALLSEAATCFEGAIEVYREAGQSKTVHVIEKNLNRVQRILETRAGGQAG